MNRLVFDASPYAPPPGGGVFGFLVMLVAGVLVALVTGVFAGVFQVMLYLIVLFPILIGGCVGFALWLIIRLTKFRRPSVTFLLGLCLGLLTVVVMHWSAKDILREELPPEAQSSLLASLDYRAEEGVQIGRAGREGFANLGYYGSIIYWIIDAAVICLVAGGIPLLQADAPFCTRCNQWKRKETFGPFRGDREKSREWVEAGEVANVGRETEPDDREVVALEVAICPRCGTDGPVDIRLVKKSEDQDGSYTSEVCHVTYPGEVMSVLMANDKRYAGRYVHGRFQARRVQRQDAEE